MPILTTCSEIIHIQFFFFRGGGLLYFSTPSLILEIDGFAFIWAFSICGEFMASLADIHWKPQNTKTEKINKIGVVNVKKRDKLKN